MVLAVGLWTVALVVFGGYTLSLVAPIEVATAMRYAGEIVRFALLAALVTFIVAALVWPPFLPSLRLSWRRLKGRLSVDRGPMLEALADLEHFETAPKHLAVARTAHTLGDVRRALPHAVKAVELDPQLLSARYTLGVLLREIGQTPEAVRQLGFVIERDHDRTFPGALIERARALLSLRADGEALVMLERHRQNYGPQRTCSLLRGRALRGLGREDEAKAAFTEAAAPPPEGVNLSAEDALTRAQAKVARVRPGRPARPEDPTPSQTQSTPSQPSPPPASTKENPKP